MDDAIAMIINARYNDTYDKIPDIVRAMEKYRGNEKLQYEAMWTLLDFACDDDENEKRIAKEGGIEAILRAMESHKTSEGVQEHGCLALANLADHAEYQKRIAKEGGIAAVLRAMESHKTSEGVQEHGCWALANLAENAENQKRIAKEGGIAAVLRAMESHKTSEDLQGVGCRAIGSLAYSPVNRSALVQQGCVEIILSAMEEFENLVLFACFALFSLSWQNPANRTHIERKGGVTRIARVVEWLSSDEETRSKMAEKAGDDFVTKCRESLDVCFLAIRAIIPIPLPKDIDARYALVASLRTLKAQVKGRLGRQEQCSLAESASYAYATRNTEDTRYLLCCITRFF